MERETKIQDERCIKSLEELKSSIKISESSKLSQEKVEDMANSIWDLCIKLNTFKIRGDFDSICDFYYVKSKIVEDLYMRYNYGFELGYVCRRGWFQDSVFFKEGKIFCYQDYDYLDADYLHNVYLCIDELIAFAEKVCKACEQDTCKYFEKLYHNSGKTLSEVLNTMRDDGFTPREIVDAMCIVLKDVQWED